ncbi:MAG: DUF4230 domain-containing protein [Spirochaetales bacterium]|nr:DUF4230 domain-containing protein [Spirochaetales bacterium]
MAKKNLKIQLTGGAVLVLGILLAVTVYLCFCRIMGQSLWGGLFREKEFQALSSTAEGIENTALLECAVYQIRFVYPYDFPNGTNQPYVDTKRHDFCIITARVAAGYDLSSFSSREEEGDRLTLSLGEPEITSFQIDDEIISGDEYPDIALTPEEWRLIIEEITPIIKKMALDRGILDEAESFGREFLGRLYKGAGYGQVSFSD